MKNRAIWRASAIISGTVLASAGMSRAAFIVDPISAVASSSYVNGSADNRSPIHAIDGSGLSSSAGLATGDPIPSSYPSDSTSPQGNEWLSNSSSTIGQTISFDLGSVYALTGFHLWNDNETYNTISYTNRGVQNVTFAYSNTGDSDSDFSSSSIPTQTLTNLAQAPGQDTYTGEDYSLTPVSAEYVRITVNSNLGGAGYDGISEIRFTAAPVPEPASLSLLALGLPCLLKRRSRSNT